MTTSRELFTSKSAWLQEFADTLPGCPFLGEIDLNESDEIHNQMMRFATRLRSQAIVTLGRQKTQEIDSFHTGVRDTAIALNGVLAKTRLVTPRLAPDRRILIARNSFPVLVRFALDQELPTTPGMHGNSYERYICPEVLDFFDGNNPKISVSSSVSSSGNPMECPAFVGRSGGNPRLPHYLWDGAIRLYDALGQFGDTPRYQTTLAAYEAVAAGEF
jgi:hypothetical protein